MSITPTKDKTSNEDMALESNEDMALEQIEIDLPEGETLFDVVLQIVNNVSCTLDFKEKLRFLIRAWRRDDKVALDAACSIVEWIEQQLAIAPPTVI